MDKLSKRVAKKWVASIVEPDWSHLLDGMMDGILIGSPCDDDSEDIRSGLTGNFMPFNDQTTGLDENPPLRGPSFDELTDKYGIEIKLVCIPQGDDKSDDDLMMQVSFEDDTIVVWHGKVNDFYDATPTVETLDGLVRELGPNNKVKEVCQKALDLVKSELMKYYMN